MMDAGIDPATRDLTGERIATLQNAVYLRLMTPLGSWWADPSVGSLLYTLQREKDLPRVARQAEAYAREALQPLLDDGRARSITVQAVSRPAPPRGTSVRRVAAEPFAVGDGVTRAFPLLFRGQPVHSVEGVPTVYRTDWQGRVELSSEARTNYAIQFRSGISGPWTLDSDLSYTDSGIGSGDGTGPHFCEIAHVNTTGANTQTGQATVPLGSTARFQVRIRAGAITTTCVVGLYNGSWAATGACSATIVSGPGVVRPYDPYPPALVHIDNLSASEDTVVELTRDTGAGEGLLCRGIVYPQNNGSGAPDTIPVGTSVLFAAPCFTVDAPAAPFIPTIITNAPRTVTDYTLASGPKVILPEPLAIGATLDADFTFDWYQGADKPPVVQGSRLRLDVEVVTASGERQVFEHPVGVI